MNIFKAAACGLTLASLCACSGGGGIFGNNPVFGGGGQLQCNTGTAQQLARPQPGTYAPGTTSVEIVASGNNNTLYNTYTQWSVILQNNGTQQMQGSPLQLVSDPSGPHPYSSDFYYSSNFGTLPSGQTWTVLLQQNNGSSCAPIPLQSFST